MGDETVEMTAPDPAPSTVSSAAATLRQKVLRAAWSSIVLGISIELLLLAVATLGGRLFRASPIAAELMQKVTWSVLVCVGIAFGSAASKVRSSVMGLLGLLSGPVAFQAARAVQKGLAQALSLAAATAPGPSPVLLALLKALEYGLLGAAVGWVGCRAWGNLAAYLGTGTLVGLILGGLTVAVLGHADTAPATAGTVIARAINEILFPIGCSLVLYAAERVGKHAAG